MYRAAIEDLKKWKENPYRKPLIIEGARQVGKTWLMKEFGNTCYKNTVYINFDSNPQMEDLFSKDLDIKRIVLGLEIYSGVKIKAEDTLLIFDEIQEVPKALSSLKYFHENAPEYNIVSAGSLLGIALHGGTSFPVGKVDFMKLYPLSFCEFLRATNRDKFVELVESKEYDLISSFREIYIEALKQYYFIGGMPEVVEIFSKTNDFVVSREMQERILMAYEQDFSKHAPYEIVPKIRMIWNSLPAQLAKENKKFIYGQLKSGARAKEYEAALMWLSDCGLVHKISRATNGKMPLKAYEDLKAFKLFNLDIGILGCMVGIDSKIILEGNRLFTEFKGALTEQYVCQQLKIKKELNIYYYTNERGSCEIDFLIDNGKEVYPIEVKAETNLKAKSLKVYYEKFNPSIAVRTSMADYKKQEWVVNVPLYGIV